MIDNLRLILHIVALAFGSIFLIISLIWILIITFHRLGDSYKTSSNKSGGTTLTGKEMKIKAAIAAAAVAVTIQEDQTPHEFPLPPTALVSAWQAVMRSEMLKRHGRPR